MYKVNNKDTIIIGREGGWASNQIFKKGGDLTRPQPLEGVAGKEEGDFFRGGGGVGWNFHINNKLKSEIFID